MARVVVTGGAVNLDVVREGSAGSGALENAAEGRAGTQRWVTARCS
jgi:hypothetical protein